MTTPSTHEIMHDHSFDELQVYRQAFDASMQIFEHTKSWPVEERYALTDQIRRSSRSVCAGLAAAWQTRHIPDRFTSKVADANADAAETRAWLRLAFHCGYLEETAFAELHDLYVSIGDSLASVVHDPEGTWTLGVTRPGNGAGTTAATPGL